MLCSKREGTAGQQQAGISAHLAVIAKKPEPGRQCAAARQRIDDARRHPGAGFGPHAQRQRAGQSQKKLDKHRWRHKIEQVVGKVERAHEIFRSSIKFYNPA